MRARAPGADRGRPAQRALRRGGPRRGARVSGALAFTLTPGHEAGAPPEARGLARDEVRLLVARRGAPLVHDSFRGLPEHLRAGDLLVVNTSATLPAALPAGELDLHLSTPLPRAAGAQG